MTGRRPGSVGYHRVMAGSRTAGHRHASQPHDPVLFTAPDHRRKGIRRGRGGKPWRAGIAVTGRCPRRGMPTVREAIADIPVNRPRHFGHAEPRSLP
jgi:hypothetical protein